MALDRSSGTGAMALGKLFRFKCTCIFKKISNNMPWTDGWRDRRMDNRNSSVTKVH